MTRQEFLDQVLSPLGRLTAEERENVRRELEEHVEDRMEALLEMGWDAGLAEERCLEAMGDPVEIGREMAGQYRGRGWLWIGRVAAALTVVMSIQALLGLGMLGTAWYSLEARISPQLDTKLDWVEAEEQLDLRLDMGNDVLRLFRVSVGKLDGRRVAEIAMCAYDRWPFGIVAHGWQNCIELRLSEKEARFGGGSGRGNYGAEYCRRYVSLEPEDRSITLTYTRFGETASLEVPIPEQEEAP
ncbi:MAG: hypothetical protein HFG05_11970 [Oscillibacter sp.]|nr:hypothetical protein [Oscillibacter sp.]